MSLVQSRVRQHDGSVHGNGGIGQNDSNRGNSALDIRAAQDDDPTGTIDAGLSCGVALDAVQCENKPPEGGKRLITGVRRFITLATAACKKKEKNGGEKSREEFPSGHDRISPILRVVVVM
jgi:hypothetical protein